jgi:hypothetical protein
VIWLAVPIPSHTMNKAAENICAALLSSCSFFAPGKDLVRERQFTTIAGRDL